MRKHRATRPLLGHAKRRMMTKTTLRDAASEQTEGTWRRETVPGSLGRGIVRTSDAVLFKGATAGLLFSSPKLGRGATIALALVARAGARNCGGTFERIRLRAGIHYRLS